MRNKNIEIIREDDSVIVIAKPSGLATQTAKIGESDVYSEMCKYRKHKGEPSEIYIIHRLDQPVCGLMLLAKTKEAAAILSEGIKDEYEKEYTALVYGYPKDNSGELTDYLLKDTKSNSSKVVDKSVKESKLSILSYEVMEKSNDTSLLKIQLKTGRHHQIRVQLSHAGYPIMGDTKYTPKDIQDSIPTFKSQGLCLCASGISFVHPVTKEKITLSYESPFRILK